MKDGNRNYENNDGEGSSMASSCSEFESSELPDISSDDNDNDDDETDIAFSSEPLASLPPPFPNLPPPSSTSSASSRTLSSLQVNKTSTFPGLNSILKTSF